MNRFLPSGLRPLQLATLLPLFLLAGVCSDNRAIAQSASPSSPTQLSPANAATTQSTAADRFFVNSKPQAPATATRPEPKGDLSFTIDVSDVRNKVARIRGWGFRIAPPHQMGDRVTILLAGSSATYSVLADMENRPDVGEALKQPGLSEAGFVSLIDTTGIAPGEYTLFLRIGGADGEAIKSTNKKLTL
jgi:hypothetical protein